MAKKGRDLFEILRERQGGSRSPSRPAARRSGAERTSGRGADKGRGSSKNAAPTGLQALRAWFRGPEPEPAPRAPAGMTLAAVAAVALLLGFVVGRVTTVEAAGPEGTAGLRRDVVASAVGSPAPGDRSPGDRAPGDRAPGAVVKPVTWQELPDADAVTRAGKVEEEKILSDLGFFLIAYPALEDGLSLQKARRLAVWLREKGLPDTRIRYLPHDSGSYFFAVISYTSNERAARDLELLQGLDFSPFGGELAEKVGSMRSPNDLSALARKKS